MHKENKGEDPPLPFECSQEGSGGLPYDKGGDARLKFWIKPLKENNLDVAQPFFDP